MQQVETRVQRSSRTYPNRVQPAEIARTKTKLQEDYPNLGRFVHQAILGEVQRLYP
jgi:hypothetical protein